MDKSIGDDGERPSLARHYQMLHELFEKFGLSSSLFGSPHRPILQFLTACNSRSSLDTFTTNFLPPSFFFCVYYFMAIDCKWDERLDYFDRRRLLRHVSSVFSDAFSNWLLQFTVCHAPLRLSSSEMLICLAESTGIFIMLPFGSWILIAWPLE